MTTRPFVLLDDARAGRLLMLSDLRRVDRVPIEAVDESLADGWANGWRCFAWLPYEAGTGATVGLYWFAHQSSPTALPEGGPGRITGLAPDIDEAQHAHSVAALQEAIASGESYQVNYTFRMRGRLEGDPVGAYLQLRDRQPAEFGVVAHLPEPAPSWLLSLSPELFLQVRDGIVTARPMKGTAPAEAPRGFLRADPKNRAENLMIVDLLRNDLSRVAVPGTVAVPSLFDVERVGSLWQLTSTVQARLAAGVTTGDVLRAAFPCGSITGAPKLSSMGLIERTETSPRGTYTGSLGLLDPDGLSLSVAIRTVEIDADGAATLGVGSGIVADSVAEDEWAESLLKARFAAQPTLKEAIRVVDGAAPLAALHSERLSAAAARLCFPAVDKVIEDAVAGTPQGAWRVGVDVAPDGSVTVTRRPLEREAGTVTLLLADAAWHPGPNADLKTDDRAALDDAWRRAVAVGAFDTIGYDEAGRVLEGGRCNVFALVDGTWVTPPATLGLLPGVQRAALLADPSQLGTDRVAEAELSLDQFRRAQRIVVTNAVQGVLDARLEEHR
ncbi:hypothetical protein BW730_03585 [Tessaracoccus aquimaris]|uniref:Chorismate-utilising enzyme C-terminal domain-containing protein n=1 Tax=Tessaracoccus aquimaris TaxID=1332264 RepID=A0A1Q2CKZ7_9ACTN|nr:bifunctional anthranilate synthase component I family protein/aminotransferase class IV [Tessaracoccus aquimaris]AQP46745.1 hypothetical protein BW730_03585 [Tessaracoccus aquimaris]